MLCCRLSRVILNSERVYMVSSSRAQLESDLAVTIQNLSVLNRYGLELIKDRSLAGIGDQFLVTLKPAG